MHFDVYGVAVGVEEGGADCVGHVQLGWDDAALVVDAHEDAEEAVEDAPC